MPKCKNDPKRSYKGTEPSPKGLSYCAHAEKLGSKKLGKDKKKWVIIETKIGSKKWIREGGHVHTKSKKVSPVKEKQISKTKKKSFEKYYDFTPVKTINWKLLYKDLDKTQIDSIDKLKNMKNEFEKNNIKFFVVPLPISRKGLFFIDYPWDVVRDKLEDNYLTNNSFIIMVIEINADGTLHNNKIMCMQHYLSKDAKIDTKNILTKKFKNKLMWDGTEKQAICIKL